MRVPPSPQTIEALAAEVAESVFRDRQAVVGPEGARGRPETSRPTPTIVARLGLGRPMKAERARLESDNYRLALSNAASIFEQVDEFVCRRPMYDHQELDMLRYTVASFRKFGSMLRNAAHQAQQLVERGASIPANDPECAEQLVQTKAAYARLLLTLARPDVQYAASALEKLGPADVERLEKEEAKMRGVSSGIFHWLRQLTKVDAGKAGRGEAGTNIGREIFSALGQLFDAGGGIASLNVAGPTLRPAVSTPVTPASLFPIATRLNVVPDGVEKLVELARKSEFARAIGLVREAEELRFQLISSAAAELGALHPDIGLLLLSRADEAASRGDAAGVQGAYAFAHRSFEASLGEEHPLTVLTAGVLERAREAPLSKDEVQRALEVVPRALPEDLSIRSGDDGWFQAVYRGPS